MPKTRSSRWWPRLARCLPVRLVRRSQGEDVTPREDALRFICTALDIQIGTLTYLLDLTADEADKAWSPDKGLSKTQFLELAVNREILDLLKQAVRSDRRHKTVPLDSLITEPAAKAEDPGSQLRINEFFYDLTEREALIVSMKANGYTTRAVAEHLHADHRTIEGHLASVASKAAKHLGT